MSTPTPIATLRYTSTTMQTHTPIAVHSNEQAVQTVIVTVQCGVHLLFSGGNL